MQYESIQQLNQAIEGILEVRGSDVAVLDEGKLKDALIDSLVYTAVFAEDTTLRDQARWLIRRAGASLGIISASIQTLYEAMGRKEVSGFTVPAINIRVLTYDVAQAVFRAGMAGKVGPIIFEIARSEIGYTDQRPSEYAASITAAAIKVGYRGPLFIQGDHFQINAKKYADDPDKELKAVKDLIWEALESGFYNIDIDTSTLVDLSKPTVKEQQYLNYSLAAELTAMIRDLEPEGVTVSVGGEIGEVGGKNSTVEELEAYMEGYREALDKAGANLKGISKISIQTGTTHGGVPMPDGTIAQVKLDFETLEKLSEEARVKYGLAGAVQHGASTLPDEAFDHFPATRTAEIHLATGFQNIIYDSRAFPANLKEKIYRYIKTDLAADRGKNDTEEQFLYKTRKKALGPFKKAFWDLPQDVLTTLGNELEKQFTFLFEKLNVNHTKDLCQTFVKPVDVVLPKP
ncbi:MAG: class II fructose-bisphosphate aldolase [Deltaproteobacteria bacterium]|nr:class II fructose-bisphosphate aldolase [Deltaproteobacteria bacterium]